MHDYLVNRPMVTVDEAYKAMVIFLEGADTTVGFDERERRLAERSLIRTDWRLDADQYIDKATVAHMVCQASGVVGGVNRMLLGSWGLGDRRYALRELQYRGVIEGGTDYSYLTGGELLGILYRADTLRAEVAGAAPPLTLPRAADESTFASPPASQPAPTP